MAGFAINRRQSLQWAGAAALGLSGCKPVPPQLDDLPGGFTGTALERGHSLRPFWQRLGFYGDGPELEKNIRLQIPNLREWVME